MRTAGDRRLRAPHPPRARLWPAAPDRSSSLFTLVLGTLCLVVALAAPWIGARASGRSDRVRSSTTRTAADTKRASVPELGSVDHDTTPPTHAAREASRLRVESTRLERAGSTHANVAPRDVAPSPTHPEATRFSDRRACGAPVRRVALGERRGTSLHERAGARLPPLRAPPA